MSLLSVHSGETPTVCSQAGHFKPRVNCRMGFPAHEWEPTRTPSSFKGETCRLRCAPGRLRSLSTHSREKATVFRLPNATFSAISYCSQATSGFR